MQNTKKGFTLVELLMVIAIIGILSAIGLTALTGARGKARDARRVADIRQYTLAFQAYFDSFNSYMSNCNASDGGANTGDISGAGSAALQCDDRINTGFFGAGAVPRDPQALTVPCVTAAGGRCTRAGYYTVLGESATTFVVGAWLESGTGGFRPGGLNGTETGLIGAP